jgi:hypothetical protein
MSLTQQVRSPDAGPGRNAIIGALVFAHQNPLLKLGHHREPECGAYSDWCDWDNSGGHNDWEDQSSGPPGGK